MDSKHLSTNKMVIIIIFLYKSAKLSNMIYTIVSMTIFEDGDVCDVG